MKKKYTPIDWSKIPKKQVKPDIRPGNMMDIAIEEIKKEDNARNEAVVD